MTTGTQVFFIILFGDVMILCYDDITVGGYALDFSNPSIFNQFFARKCYVSSCTCQKVFKKVASNVLHSSLVLMVQLIDAEYT